MVAYSSTEFPTATAKGENSAQRKPSPESWVFLYLENAVPKQDLSAAAQAKRVGTALAKLTVKAKKTRGTTHNQIDKARDDALRAEEAQRLAESTYDAEALFKHPGNGQSQLCRRMTPGEWYTLAELRVLLPEYRDGSVKALLVKSGYFKKKNNPEVKPRGYLPGSIYVYALNEVGEAINASEE